MDKEAFLQASAPQPRAGDFYQPPAENPPSYYAASQSTPHQHPGYHPYTQAQYPYPPPQTASQEQAPQTHTVIQVVSPLPSFGSRPANTRCPFCHEDILTRVTRRFTGSTHMCACLLCCCCLCCFAWVPYVTDCMNDIEHECPNCNKFLGVFTRPTGRRQY